LKEQRKWVFEEVVEHEKDVVGFIAYAMYKSKKHNVAESLKKTGASEQVIQDRVQTFHDQVLMSNSLSSYRKAAEIFISELLNENSNELTKDHEKKLLAAYEDYKKKIARLESEYKKSVELQRKKLENDKKQLYRKIQNYPLVDKSESVDNFV
jgi:rubrerythrin